MSVTNLERLFNSLCRMALTRNIILNLILKMLPVTELMNIPDATFVKSTQSSATIEQT